MQRGLGRRFNTAITIFTPALLFAALHAPVYSHPAYLLIPLALGITLGLVAERSRSLWPSIALHAIWNFTMLAIPTRAAEGSLVWRTPEDMLGVVTVLAGIGLSSIVLLSVLPRAGHRSDPKAVLDTQVAT
jgi:membrane protease YdiL (CAAX protease family)